MARMTTPAGAAAAPAEVHSIELALPAAWARIAITDPRQCRADCEDLVRHMRSSAGPPSAEARAHIRRDLQRATRVLREQGAIDYALGLRPGEPIPMPCTFVLFGPEGPPTRHAPPEEVLRELERAARAEPGEHEWTLRRMSAAGSRALRLHCIRMPQLPHGRPATGLPRLTVQYLLIIPGGDAFLTLVFETPLTDGPAASLELFDGIVRAGVFAAAPVARPVT